MLDSGLVDLGQRERLRHQRLQQAAVGEAEHLVELLALEHERADDRVLCSFL